MFLIYFVNVSLSNKKFRKVNFFLNYRYNEIMTFYDRIKMLLNERGMTVEEFVHGALGPQTTVGSYQAIKNRGILYRADDALAIAEFFGVTLEWLITGEEKNDHRTDEEKHFHQVYMQLSESNRKMILELMENLK